MRKLAVFFIAVLALAQAPSTFQPVGNMSQLMVDIIYPTSDAIFYIERNAPQNDHDWGVVRMNALTLAESGNLLMMDRRARDQGRLDQGLEAPDRRGHGGVQSGAGQGSERGAGAERAAQHRLRDLP